MANSHQIRAVVKAENTLANFISILRPILTFYVLIKFQSQPLLLAILIVIIILLDAVDGIVARRFGGSKWGAYVDIVADRAVELIILFMYAYWGMISYVFPIIFLVRGIATDFLRILNNRYKDEKFKEPLSLGKADNRWVRGIYGFIKLAAFSLILLLPTTGYILLIIALIFNLYRGLPVIFSARSRFLIKKFLS